MFRFTLRILPCLFPFIALAAFATEIDRPSPAEGLVCKQQNFAHVKMEAEKGVAWAQSCLGRLYLDTPGAFNKYRQAVHLFQLAADQGDSAAMTALGECYQHGKGIGRDRVKAVELYEKAAEAGYAQAQKLLGDCLADHIGIGLPADRKKALYWYEKAAAQGDADAQHALGKAHEWGEGLPKDIAMAYTRYFQAMQGGNANAIWQLARMNAFGEGDITAPNRKKEAALLFRAARAGNLNAMSSIAFHFQGFDALPRSYAMALDWARKADSLKKYKNDVGEVESVKFAKEIGKFDSYGKPTEPDSRNYGASASTAASWHKLGQQFWRSGADNGNLEAAAKWFQQAANENYAPALVSLGFCYLVGLGVSQDDARALECYERGASLGNAEAADFAGFCYEYGIGAPPDIEKAIEYYIRAAELGDPGAQFGLAFRYLHGFGVAKDERKAAALYASAADSGYFRAMNALARCYEKGIGVPKDGAKAWFWHKISAETATGSTSDVSDAKRWLETHNSDGTLRPSDEEKKLRAQAEAGDAEAMGRIGQNMMRKVNATEDELREGISWLRKAADANDSYALGWLAHYYAIGLGAPRDLTKAFELRKKLAALNGKYDQSDVAQCYEDGIGVARDRNEAIAWYKKGAALGDAKSREALDELQ